MSWSLRPPRSSAPLSRDAASSRPPVQPAVGLTDGRGGLRLPEEALAAGQASLHDQAAHDAGLNLLKVVRLCSDFSLQEADVRLIASLLVREVVLFEPVLLPLAAFWVS